MARLVSDWILPLGWAERAVRVWSPTTAVGDGCCLRVLMHRLTRWLALVLTRWVWAENLPITVLGIVVTVYVGPWLWFTLCVLYEMLNE